MGILDEDVARVREATDLVALIGERVALKRVGRRFVGLCPFHTEKSPSFSVNPELHVYYCFGCQQSGDAITFLRTLDGLDFVEAVERLAQRAGIALRYDDANVSKDRQRRQRLVEAVAASVDFYHRVLLEAPDAGRARGYLRSRGFDGDAARRFSLGWSGDAFDALTRHLYDRKFSRDDVLAAGLGFVNRAQRVQDFFRNRLMFPIFDTRGDPVGFGGRALDANGPKYKNTPDTALYHKSRLLYGLNWAKGEIGARDAVVICEGYTDVMAFALAGVPNAVATCGTALTDEHVQMLKNFTRRMILAYDSDAAGQHAAERWYQWEQRFDIEIRVAALPAGQDPADVFGADHAALEKAVADAPRFLQFKLDRILASADLTSPEGRARAAGAVVPVLREHPNELVREQYIGPIAATLDVDHAWFKEALARRSAPPRAGGDPGDGGARAGRRAPVSVDRRELDALRWAIHEPQQVAGWLDAALFADPAAREVFELLATSATFDDALDRAEGPVRDILERLAVEEPESDADPEVVHAQLVISLVEPAALRLHRSLVNADDERASQVKIEIDRLVNARLAGEWLTGEAAAMQLVRWVVEWE